MGRIKYEICETAHTDWAWHLIPSGLRWAYRFKVRGTMVTGAARTRSEAVEFINNIRAATRRQNRAARQLARLKRQSPSGSQPD